MLTGYQVPQPEDQGLHCPEIVMSGNIEINKENIDHSGDDHYYAKSFSQGQAYYFGLGIFYEHSGEDQYNIFSHRQGYAAHYALSGFIENKGIFIYINGTNKFETH